MDSCVSSTPRPLVRTEAADFALDLTEVGEAEMLIEGAASRFYEISSY